MALRWSIRNIMGFKRNPDDYYVPVENKKGSKVFDIQPITKHLVYETMIVGLSEITESNIDEWLIRMRLVEKLYNTSLMMRDDKGVVKPYRITIKDLQNHVGLWTNAERLTRKKFVNNCVSGVLRDITNNVYKDVENERIQEKKELDKKVVPISKSLQSALKESVIN
tara:strand:- start:4082 stop:4582 length:501 start_codon:yes stop_codon:yes gene_type:complete